MYEYIFTTNYDLLYYWSISRDEERFKDYLWYMMFDAANTVIWGNVSKVLYLHGALHLYQDSEGCTRKRGRRLDAGSILRQIDDDHENFPLFVSEGTSKDKMVSIRRNDYLSFAFQRLLGHNGSMVVFGHSLTAEYDEHILSALMSIEKRRYHMDRRRGQAHSPFELAISMLPSMPEEDIVREKARLLAALPKLSVVFFNATTHPLGDARVRIPGPPDF